MSALQMKYFVLKPAGGDAYAVASRSAMRTYALSIAGENPELSADLLAWINKEELADFIDRPSTKRLLEEQLRSQGMAS